jgi:SAM-dependent methyltransferase
MSSDTEAQAQADATDQFVDRLLGDATAALGLFVVFIGDELGYYEALAGDGPLTSAELAAATDTDERYAREWLEHQTVAGVVAVDDETADALARRYSLPTAHVEPLTDPESSAYAVPLAPLVKGAVEPIDDLVEAFRSGEGVPYERYGDDFREGQGRINRPTFLSDLGDEWIPAMPDVDERLRSDPPARIADVGCGFGWSAVGLARAYPGVRVDAYDLDPPSVAAARETVAEAGVADRVRVYRRDVTDPDLAGDYDLVTAFECVHDMADPVGALRSMRRLAGDDGAVLVADERVGETFTADGTDAEPLLYGWSVLHCLPVGRERSPSAATGTVMRAETLTAYASEAGFERVEVLPVSDFFFRLYRLSE